jgi:NitT/TauT family transport system substrate-binding protein
VTQHSDTGSEFLGRKFSDFATIKESLIARRIDASFILAPLAMQLVASGVPIKIVYLGHRDGTTLMVPTKSNVREFSDLRGKKVAIPNRFSNQNVLMHRMMRKFGMSFDSIKLIELPPPEHPTALASGSIDAYIIGEPFAAQAEMDGYGRVLYYTKDMWPGFISCVLVVRQEMIDEERELVQELVNGIAKSGKWLDQDMSHRMDAAEIVGKYYYLQDPELLKFVLSKPPDRVKYTSLGPLKKDFDEIMDLAVEMGVLKERLEFEQYVDTSFVTPIETLDWNLDQLPRTAAEASGK